MAKILSIDIETGGLDRNKHSMLEISVILYDTDTGNLNTHLSRTFLFREEVYRITPYCIDMHSKNGLLHDLNDKNTAVAEADIIDAQLVTFLDDNLTPDDKFLVLGKNFGVFDYQWIKAYLPEFAKQLSHRFVDLGSLYLEPTDRELPSLSECLSRAGIVNDNAHRAYDDALVTLKAMLKKFNYSF